MHSFPFQTIPQTGLCQELASQTRKSVTLLCDASPKGKMNVSQLHIVQNPEHLALFMHKVWLPVVSVNDFAAVLSLQRFTDLHASTVDESLKMSMAHRVADEATAALIADPRKGEHRAKLILGCNNRTVIYGVCALYNYSKMYFLH